ncbi:uncharacterized protein KQ657_001959 [Scheffersomyces spartinae]|uniref:Autophagy-related protein 17 n=1 Tax=Scheffersomyces spartinae TaxID=45513 RepID=A0A9P7V6R9_9ASCO|nr:uncharacterized protein KQ657_001959 [Scheffersomyces spartinae]KAG7192241.1 hypothetical protein KQ657_001959 [Scheffersomyces spartinae]
MTSNGVVSKAEIIQWTEEALSALKDARILCTEASIMLEKIKHTLTITVPDKIEYAEFLIEKVGVQNGRIGSIVQQIQKKVQGDLIDTFERKWNSQMIPAMKILDDILGKLSETKIPEFVLDPNNEDPNDESKGYHRYLRDFVSDDAIELLKSNIHIHETRARLIHKMLKAKFNLDVLIPFQKLQKFQDLIGGDIQKQLQVLETLLYELKDKTGFTQNVLKENVSLELELVSLLEMLTKHYDQCLQGKKLFTNSRTGSVIAIDSDILRNDSQAVPGVTEELKTLYDMVKHNNDRVTKLVDSRLPYLNTERLVEYLDRIRHYQATNIVGFLQLLYGSEKELVISSVPDEDEDDGDVHVDPLDTYISMVGDLSFHYNKFYHIYKTKYLSELHNEQYVFPRKIVRLLTEFFDKDMLQLQTEETERRRAWLAKYGDFIPKEFWLPGEQSQPHVVQVITEGVDENELRHDLENEQRLLQLIRQMRDMK